MSHDPEAGRKLREAVETYATNQATGRRLSLLEAVLDCFVPDDQSQSELRSLLIDLVFRYLLAAGRMHYASGPEETADERLDQFLTRYTRLTGVRAAVAMGKPEPLTKAPLLRASDAGE